MCSTVLVTLVISDGLTPSSVAMALVSTVGAANESAEELFRARSTRKFAVLVCTRPRGCAAGGALSRRRVATSTVQIGSAWHKLVFSACAMREGVTPEGRPVTTRAWCRITTSIGGGEDTASVVSGASLVAMFAAALCNVEMITDTSSVEATDGVIAITLVVA